jgi:hypothetical protein
MAPKIEKERHNCKVVHRVYWNIFVMANLAASVTEHPGRLVVGLHDGALAVPCVIAGCGIKCGGVFQFFFSPRRPHSEPLFNLALGSPAGLLDADKPYWRAPSAIRSIREVCVFRDDHLERKPGRTQISVSNLSGLFQLIKPKPGPIPLLLIKWRSGIEVWSLHLPASL